MRVKKFTKDEIEAIKPEDKFVEELVIPLLWTIAEVCKFRQFGPVKIEFWGKDKRKEASHGIDVYFGYFDHTYRPKHIGIQCKIENIICGSKATLTNSIETIRNQIFKAYGHDFISPLDSSTSSRINGFYLITSKTINPEARDMLKKSGFVNLDFFDSDNLLHLLEKYLEDKIV